MAATKYTYSISTDFPTQKENSDTLAHEIEDSAIASAAFLYINTGGDVCDIWFDDPLSAGDQTLLDGVVAAHQGDPAKRFERVTILAPWDPVDAGVSKVVANGRSAIEIEDAITGFATTALHWPFKQDAGALLHVHIQFILKASGTGSAVRIGIKAKATATGEDSALGFSPEGFEAETITYTTIGEVFEAIITADGSGFEEGDAVALQIGRDGNNEMGAGDNDDVNVPVQIISIEVGRLV